MSDNAYVWTNENEENLTRLHDKLEANGFQRSRLSPADRRMIEYLEEKWTDLHDFPPTSNPAN